MANSDRLLQERKQQAFKLDNLSTNEKAMFCSFPFKRGYESNLSLRRYQIEIAKELGVTYEKGSESTAHDLHLAKKHRQIACDLEKEILEDQIESLTIPEEKKREEVAKYITGLKQVNARLHAIKEAKARLDALDKTFAQSIDEKEKEIQSYFDKIKCNILNHSRDEKQTEDLLSRLLSTRPQATPSTTSSTTTADSYRRLGWFTTSRLFLWRGNRFAEEVGTSFFSFVKPPCTFGGLSYGVELAIDLAMIGKALFKPTPSESTSAWQRVKNMVKKGNRAYRMTNAVLWLGINIAGLVLTGGASIAINLVGFAIDVVHEIVDGIRDVRRHNKLLKKVDDRLQAINDELNPSHCTIAAAKNLCQEKSNLLTFKKALQEKITDVKKTRALVIGLTAAIFVGMVLFWCSPATILGAAIAFSASCVFLGRRIRNTYFAPQVKPVDPVMLENDVKDVTDEENRNANTHRRMRSLTTDVTSARPSIQLATANAVRVDSSLTSSRDEDKDTTPSLLIPAALHGRGRRHTDAPSSVPARSYLPDNLHRYDTLRFNRAVR